MSENYFTFGSVDCRTLGVKCSGGGTYSAPARDVELFHVLGRDGDLVVDHGSYQNIDVTYPCWIARNAPGTIDAFRAALCSLRGYQKIVDPYHPNEYRMGIYQTTFMPEMLAANNDSAEFDVIFNCKPQRYLNSGDTKQTVTSGSNVSNPTKYPAKPLLEVKGYGDITIGGKTVTIQNVPIGKTLLSQTQIVSVFPIELNSNLYNTGDLITVNSEGTASALVQLEMAPAMESLQSVTLTDTGGTGVTLSNWGPNTSLAQCRVTMPTWTATAGTSKTVTHTFDLVVVYKNGGTTYTATGHITVTLTYTASTNKITASISGTTSASNPKAAYEGGNVYSGSVYVNSSISAHGDPTYIDLDIGEAWMEEDDEKISVNKSVYIPDIMPVLKGNQNTVVTFSNTITRLDLIPRWYTI